jgi:hypothetical protein
MSGRIDASHARTVVDGQVRASQEAALLAREAARDRTAPEPKAPEPEPPAPKPAAKKPAPAKPKPAAKKPTPNEPPPGWLLLDPPTASAVRKMIDSHPQTRRF